MASEHDKAVLWSIFNPTAPFGDIPGLNEEKELTDDGTVCACLYHLPTVFCTECMD